ncbi:hypothetical protein CONLIGDRAFT_278283 [Coniochaeta ligniaria NRRL 30616]|uniref:Uncharacterized protein n=1 Tax=Coniochaeta ligniaria NRRL 30616 TaxID=1408157 RepID=A0A1J7IZK0_9PEZI|nr:hypothetical protein CONLIGDRAFT_278283 [Coniochaeta ligniaria NRRL 30616]
MASPEPVICFARRLYHTSSCRRCITTGLSASPHLAFSQQEIRLKQVLQSSYICTSPHLPICPGHCLEVTSRVIKIGDSGQGVNHLWLEATGRELWPTRYADTQVTILVSQVLHLCPVGRLLISRAIRKHQHLRTNVSSRHRLHRPVESRGKGQTKINACGR